MNIYFKDVEQGDTIFVHWDDEFGITKYGLIDCNIVNKGIKTVTDHIEDCGITQFDFVLMSHPHTDHFSGFEHFLKYCKTKSIGINRFLHTCSFDPTYLQHVFHSKVLDGELLEKAVSIVGNTSDKNTLRNIYTLLYEEHSNKEGFINSVHIVNSDYVIRLSANLKLKFWAPHAYDELREYTRASYDILEGQKTTFTERRNHPLSNYLSSFLQIYSEVDNWQVLLCSDTTKYTFKRLKEKSYLYEELRKLKLLAAQIPHHGSAGNHFEEFWKEIANFESAQFIVSVGGKYGHPHKKVIDFFGKNTSGVHSTNFVGGFKELYVKSKKNKMMLDSYAGFQTLASTDLIPQPFLGDERCGEKVLNIYKEGDVVKCRVFPGKRYD